MHAARSHIGNHASQAWGQLLLNVEIPLHDVIAFRVLDICRATRMCDESDILTREVEKGTRAGIVDRGIRKEGCCLSAKEYELIRQREYVEQAVSHANCSSSIVERIPGKTEPRFKVVQGWIAEESPCARATAQHCPSTNRQRVRQVSKIGKLAAGLCWYRGHLIAKADVEC